MTPLKGTYFQALKKNGEQVEMINPHFLSLSIIKPKRIRKRCRYILNKAYKSLFK